ncbi:hypothetical protein [Micromonospora sp. NPDC048839]|uniref:hypothetical protein n=1 Tax=Micromonospora sp. NPDC048839 TaxID=3155641 RepID=UPI0033FC36F2
MTDHKVAHPSDETGSRSGYCVYLYRQRGVIVYVGRGASPQRALDHTTGSHNPQLENLILGREYEIEIAGPYADSDAAAQVEAALISALKPAGRHDLYNKTAGEGPKFRPLGVPAEFADRQMADPLTLTQVGQMTGGALIVRNAFGADLAPGRPRLDPLRPDSAVLIDNLRRHWQLNRLHEEWSTDLSLKPHVAMSAAGPVGHRYVAAAVPIDRAALGDEPRDEIPLDLVAAPNLDACGLRGRLLADVRFSNIRQNLVIWVDGFGAVRWPRP